MSRKLIPILFSTPMVQAILAGRKTQTRRVVKVKRPLYLFVEDGVPYETTDKGTGPVKCPYGQPGDVLWVREKFTTDTLDGTLYNFYAGNNEVKHNAAYNFLTKWKPGIHMPKHACRLFLLITDIRVERLNDITERDAKAEGVELLQPWLLYKNYRPRTEPINGFANPYSSFESLWREINGGVSWDSNPWVWVVEFKRISKEEAML